MHTNSFITNDLLDMIFRSHSLREKVCLLVTEATKALKNTPRERDLKKILNDVKKLKSGNQVDQYSVNLRLKYDGLGVIG